MQREVVDARTAAVVKVDPFALGWTELPPEPYGG